MPPASEFVNHDRVLIPNQPEGKLITLQEVTDHATATVRPAKSQAIARVAAVLAEKPDAITAVIAQEAKVIPRTVRPVKADKTD